MPMRDVLEGIGMLLSNGMHCCWHMSMLLLTIIIAPILQLPVHPHTVVRVRV